uniref:Disintegrin and metalloproteinase domain-containing protein 5 n=1 Tax=Sciurus vulgaris TaxID=55149 RepID=A0A8D2JQU5_SCIVU
MFILLVLLTGLGGLHAGYKSHKNFLHTTVPEKISSTDAKHDPEKKVAYIITIEGKPYFLYTCFSLCIFQMDCNYNGYVAGFVNSLVTLNTCSGLRGILQFKNVSYGIEPIETLSGFMHMIYEEKSNQINIPRSGKRVILVEFDESPHESKRNILKTEYTMLFPRYLEMHIVVDKNMFDYMGSDIKTVTQKVIDIVGLVNTMLAQLKLTIMLSSIKIWSNKNKISTVGPPENVLFRFLQWKQDNLKFQYTISFLFVFVKHAASIGVTFPGKVCNENYDAGIALYSEGLSWESYAVAIVQLLGVNIGLTYDRAHCYCTGETCTMTPNAVYSGGIKDFSTCSVDDFKYLASKHGLACLESNPSDVPVLVEAQRKICGNGLIEEGEQCDCGTALNCTHKACCDPSSCSLKGNSECGSGECCTQACKLKPANILCRKSFDKDCDFQEYCNGKEAYCVLDTYARTGQPCSSGTGYCFEGLCRTFDQQCKNLIGGDSTGGSFTCFEEINSRWDRFGNCGGAYCRFGNMLCGKLVCSWPHKNLIIRPNLSVVYAHVREEICVSTYLTGRSPPLDTITTYKTYEHRDESFVEDGSMCGPRMFCFRMVCREIRHFVDEEGCHVSRDCGDQGICNNLNHCHCNKGFVPPNCQAKSGEFGSIDDGHMIKMGWLNSRFEVILHITLAYVCIVLSILALTLFMKEKVCPILGDFKSRNSIAYNLTS